MGDQTFIEFIIDATLDHYQTPKSERKRARHLRKKQYSSPYSHKWFGMMPSTFKYFKDSLKRKDK